MTKDELIQIIDDSIEDLHRNYPNSFPFALSLSRKNFSFIIYNFSQVDSPTVRLGEIKTPVYKGIPITWTSCEDNILFFRSLSIHDEMFHVILPSSCVHYGDEHTCSQPECMVKSVMDS